MLRAHGATDKGRTRPTNEDCFVIDEPLGLLLVADGMGGHNAGEVAARLAVESVVRFVRDLSGRRAKEDTWPFGFDASLSEPGNTLRTAIHLANLRILETAGTDDEYAGMGTTIVAALVDGARLSVAHVGDSRLYVAEGGRLRQLTHDDSWMATVLAQDPSVDPAILRAHPMRNALTNVVGARSRTEVHIAEEELHGGELIALTTDGVHGALEEGQLERLLRANGSLQELAESLVSAALAVGSRDNCTAVVARYVPD